MAGRGVDLDNQTIAMVKSGESIDKILPHFTGYVDKRSSSWTESEREECVGCLWNKLFCASVQFNHEDLADKLVDEPDFQLWVKRWSQNTKLYGPCPLTTSVHYENLESAKRLVDLGMDIHRDAPMMFLVPVPSGSSPGGDRRLGDPEDDLDAEIQACDKDGEVCHVYEETRCCTAMDPTPLGRGDSSLHPPLLSENTWASIS